MEKNRKPIVVIGEGLTEFYYFNSIRQAFRQLQIRPVYPRHSTSILELEEEIMKAIDADSQKIFCVVDMDNKKSPKEKETYERMKKRLEGKHKIKRTGLEYEIRFIETERCTELFFLFYFVYTSRLYANQTELFQELNKYCQFQKKEERTLSRTHHCLPAPAIQRPVMGTRSR